MRGPFQGSAEQMGRCRTGLPPNSLRGHYQGCVNKYIEKQKNFCNLEPNFSPAPFLESARRATLIAGVGLEFGPKKGGGVSNTFFRGIA